MRGSERRVSFQPSAVRVSALRSVSTSGALGRGARSRASSRSISASRVAIRLLRWARATGETEVIADVGDIPLLKVSVVAWTGLAHDDSPLVIRDRGTRDLYALDWEAP